MNIFKRVLLVFVLVWLIILTVSNIRALTSEAELISFTLSRHKPNTAYTKLNDYFTTLASQNRKINIICDYKRNEAFHIDSYYFMYPSINGYYRNSDETWSIVENANKGDVILFCDNSIIASKDFLVQTLLLDDKVFDLNIKN